jgi:hypothetical protein
VFDPRLRAEALLDEEVSFAVLEDVINALIQTLRKIPNGDLDYQDEIAILYAALLQMQISGMECDAEVLIGKASDALAKRLEECLSASPNNHYEDYEAELIIRQPLQLADDMVKSLTAFRAHKLAAELRHRCEIRQKGRRKEDVASPRAWSTHVVDEVLSALGEDCSASVRLRDEQHQIRELLSPQDIMHEDMVSLRQPLF